MCIYIYMYIYRERERDQANYVYLKACSNIICNLTRRSLMGSLSSCKSYVEQCCAKTSCWR